jgi:hypothetical protein
VIINDSNAHLFAEDIKSRGLCGCLPRKTAYGSLEFAKPAEIEVIAWADMPDAISDEEKNQNSLEHLFMDSKARGCLKVLNQHQLNYCWLFSAVQALMFERELMGLPFVALSPSSLAYIVNFVNQGGYIEDALKALCAGGAASTAYAPEATNDRSKFHDGWQADAEKYKVTMWADVPGSNQPNAAQIQFSQLLSKSKRPMPNGRNFMGHSMLSLRVLDKYPKLPCNNPNRYSVRDLNSWGDNEDGGMVDLEGQHAIADQCYTLLQAEFTA